jgi:peptide-methionine (S)-S-oxide reductase
VSQAIFAAGCFWGVEAAFREIPGVTATTVGYTGGTVENPSYRVVCTGRTGHAEAVQVEFDPDKVSYVQLLDVFWASHDPTTLNRQGWDIGTQYRSAIFFNDAAQQAAATASLQARQGQRRKPIVTEITPASTFYPAENYHQQYLEKRGQASCHVGLKSDQPVIDAEPNVQGGTSIWQKLSKIGSSKT